MNVVFIMLDGLRPDAINEQNTPELCRFMQRASYTLNGRSVVPPVTLPCHTSIFHSVPPQRHGITDNNWHPMSRPVKGLVEQLKYHDKRTGMIYNWEQLRDISRPGELYFNTFIDTSYSLDGDDIIAELAIPHLRRRAFDFTFVYFASIDMSGHYYGWMEEGYIQQATRVDGLVKQVLEAIDDETTVIIHSDHGGHERDHGIDCPEDMTIPWMIAGKNIKQNYQIQQPVSLLDTAPTVAYLLDVPAHRDWEGCVPMEVFEEGR